jgi:precorrin-6Y C5,15-methyltransferase (decarboxylating)
VFTLKVYLVGVGMGNPDLLTAQAKMAIESSDLLIGAPRLLELFSELSQPKLSLVRSEEIASAINQSAAAQAAVLLSGDIGYFSGATALRALLDQHEVISLPGISSLVYFCAQCSTPWQDAYSVSCHGRDGGAVAAVQSHRKTFLLTGGQYKVETLCRLLAEGGLGNLPASAGEYLSYPTERIVHGTVSELAENHFADLAVLLVENSAPIHAPYQAPGLPDDAFQRGKVPMTKEEVRTLAISKLKLRPTDLLWDIGAGTGSVSIECAQLLPEGRVYAVEKNPEGAALIQENARRFHCSNLHLVEGDARGVVQDLPAPDRVFIGGSNGALFEVISAALEKNPSVRIVLTAITLETVSLALDAIKHFSFTDTEIIQVSISRAQSVAAYHMMRAENPIYLISMERAQ